MFSQVRFREMLLFLAKLLNKQSKLRPLFTITQQNKGTFGSKTANLRKKEWPNYFFCIRINNKEVLNVLQT